MTFNGSAVTYMESEVMIKNVMKVLSAVQLTDIAQRDKDERKWRQMAGLFGGQMSKDVCWLTREPAPST